MISRGRVGMDGRIVAKASATIEELREPPRVTAEKVAPGRGAVGLAVRPLTPAIARQLGLSDHWGLLVDAVEDASPAAEAGLQVGDVIVEVDHHPAKTIEDLADDVRTRAGGTPVLVLVHRKDDSLFVALA
jgi:serine protease Do